MLSRPMRSFLTSAAGRGSWFAQPQTVIALLIIRYKVHGWIFDNMRTRFASRIGRKPARKGRGAEAAGFMRRISSQLKSAFWRRIFPSERRFRLYYSNSQKSGQ